MRDYRTFFLSPSSFITASAKMARFAFIPFLNPSANQT
jgi:hypothetical protein